MLIISACASVSVGSSRALRTRPRRLIACRALYQLRVRVETANLAGRYATSVGLGKKLNPGDPLAVHAELERFSGHLIPSSRSLHLVWDVDSLMS